MLGVAMGAVALIAELAPPNPNAAVQEAFQFAQVELLKIDPDVAASETAQRFAYWNFQGYSGDLLVRKEAAAKLADAAADDACIQLQITINAVPGLPRINTATAAAESSMDNTTSYWCRAPRTRYRFAGNAIGVHRQ